MPNHKSCLKRIRQTKKKNYYNTTNKKLVKKATRTVLESENHADAMVNLNKAYSILDKVAARGVYHKNTVSRKKSRLNAIVKKMMAA
jgi:small subunit ribosomal protein S20